jgi:uncharacterized delta-60 repeat protein
MKKNHSQNVDLIKDRKTCGKNRNFFCSVGRKINLLIFVFLLIAMANVMTRGQMADEFNPNVTNQNTNSAVSVIQPLPDGKIIIGGNFTSVGGQTRNHLARLNADGTLDTTFANTNLSNPVRAVALQPDGKIIVGTVGLTLPAQTANQMFRFNADGTLDTSFNPNVNNGVYAVTRQADGKIIIGGFFSNVNGQSRNNLARLNGDGTLDASFTLTPDAAVITEARQPDGKILIGGIFSNISGVARNRLARLNADGTLDTSFNSPIVYDSGRGVQDIAVQPDGKIIIGGYPSADGSVKTVARLNADGAPDAAFNQNVLSFGEDFRNIRAVAVQSNGKILLSGSFISPQPSLIRLNADGTTDTAFNPRPTTQNSPISSVDVIVVQPDQKILVGGYFTRIGGANRNSLARLFSDSRSVPATGFDFDGDGRADISAFRPSNGVWQIFQSATQFQSNGGLRSVAFGIASDRLAPADYDGDFITDIAVFREGSPAYFYILQSRTNTFRAEPFGTTGDVPVSGDWDGDTKADVAVYRLGASAGAQSYFYYRPTAAGVDFRQLAWGAAGDKPVVGDFDGDGKQDAAVFRPSNGTWYVLRSSDNQLQAIQFGIASDKLIAADYDGDNKTDFAVYRGGTWYIQRSQLGFTGIAFGAPDDIPAPADYDGDGKTDYGVFRNGIWYLNRSTAGSIGGSYSAAGDKPIPGAFVQ